MPFQSAKQELHMKINHPKIYRKWLKKYGHHPGYYELMRRKKRRKKKRKRKISKRRKKKR
jgi:hypothetical protein